jgi:hypothetical protein
MTNSFAELYEKAIRPRPIKETALLRPDMGDSKSSVVLAKQEPDFCEKLAGFANTHTEALAELLGADPAVVRRWPHKIKEAKGLAEKAKAETQQKIMLPTGV